ncbi:uncharacterized protein PADG_04443 [Paracoccidioides brasiliensis Pb18]|uniref:SP-RING-type domain-containing protein n=1 Tax=Paracoccidioides brasiliensis (strain Pb18) TaxID=502780 RepID=C1GB07_PARBD|nr:uncharacterized protein PADG_04443 [Paracoccidioides brasiliensis Pb18]EEH48359.2 hypothetical protein PADG_04443 [Paracoccidioides brasiliensis Pb18]
MTRQSSKRLQNSRSSSDVRNPGYEISFLNSTLKKFLGGKQKPWMLNPNSVATTKSSSSAATRQPNPTSTVPRPSPIQRRDSEKAPQKSSITGEEREPILNTVISQNTPNIPGQAASINFTPSSEQLPISPVSFQPGPKSLSASPHILNSQLADKTSGAPTNARQIPVIPTPDSCHGTSVANEAAPLGNIFGSGSDSESGALPGASPIPPLQPPPRPARQLPAENHTGELPYTTTTTTTGAAATITTPAIGYSPQFVSSQSPAMVAMANNSPTAEVHRNKRARTATANSPLLQTFRLRNSTALVNAVPTSDMMNNSQQARLAGKFSLKFYKPLLDRIPTTPGRPEEGRIALLRNACEAEDIFYVALHQVYCLTTASPVRLALPKFGAQQIRGLEALSPLLIKNDYLSKTFIHSCAHFPALIGDLTQNCSAYSKTLDCVMDLLAGLADCWAQFERTIILRGYPPLIDEFRSLGVLSSPTLQHVIFVASCRHLTGNRNDRALRIYLSIFQKNQEFYRQRIQRMLTANPVSAAQVRTENEYLVGMYTKLRRQHLGINRALHNQQMGSQQPHQNQGIHFTPTSGPNGQHQHQPFMTQGSLPPSAGAHHQIQSTFPTHSPNTTQNPLQQPQGYAFGPSMSEIITAPHTLTPAPAAAQVQSHAAPGRSGVQLASNPMSGLPPGCVAQLNNKNAPLHCDSLVPPSVQLPHENRVNIQPPPNRRNHLLLPPPGFVPMESANPNPLIVGLHQAHLKDKFRALNNNNEPRASGPEPLFHYLQSFAIAPSSIRTSTSVLKWQFTISPEEFQKFPVQLQGPKQGSRLWGIADGRRTYQLRCIKKIPPFQKLQGHEWAISDTAWPTVIYIHVNGTEYFVHRKVHNGKDLPVHITPSLKEGVNEVSLTILWGPPELNSKSVYCMAVEVLEYAKLSRVRTSIQHHTLSKSIEGIKNRLTSSDVASADDDLAVVDEHITIDLTDPFMARIFDTPARAKYCSHMECFDLETFLTTRLTRSVKGHGMAEDWKCPICGNDARPQSLIIDDFLVEVRRKLKEEKLLDDVKAILVRQDGSWKRRVEGINGHSNRFSKSHSLKRKRESSERSELDTPSQHQAGQQLPSAPEMSQDSGSVPEIIELD